MQQNHYDWDLAGNLARREDRNAAFEETFQYDGRHRLWKVFRDTGGGPQLAEESLYSASGNLTKKGAVTNYLYTPGHPHAVTQVTTPAGTRSFGYDANGNLTTITGAGGNHTLTWFSDNKPKKITDAATGELSEFWYDAERSRWKQVSQSPCGSEIRYYVEGGLYERLHTGGTIHHIHQIQVAGRIVAQVTRFPSAPEQVRWFHADHLGSVEAITRENGTVEERFSYDAWGKRRNPDTRLTPPPGQFLSAVDTWRGYTGECLGGMSGHPPI